MPTPPTRVGFYVPASGNYTTNTTPKVTPTFNVVAGDLLVVTASQESGLGSTIAATNPTASGGSVTWTRRLTRPTTAGVSSQSYGVVWTGVVGATATGITISTVRPSTDTTVFWGTSVTHWRDHGGVGVLFSGDNGQSGSSAPSINNTVSARSAVMILINDWNAVDGTTRTWRTVNGFAMNEALYLLSTSHQAVYAGYRLDVGTGGSCTVGLTTPSTMRWIGVGIEILGAPDPISNDVWGIAL